MKLKNKYCAKLNNLKISKIIKLPGLKINKQISKSNLKKDRVGLIKK